MRRALLLENDDALAEAMIEALAERGWLVTHVASITAARIAIERGDADLVLVDLALGSERGRHLLDDVAALSHVPPMLIVSGHPNARAISQEFGIGLVAKPFDLAHLVAAMETAVDYRIRPRPRRGGSGPRRRVEVIIESEERDEETGAK